MVEGYNFFMQPLVNILRLNEEEDWRRTSIFQTHVACQGRLCTFIIDGGSCSNLASEKLVEKLNLKTEDHPNPYQIAWVNDTSILVSSRCLVTVIILSYQHCVMFCRWKLPIMLGRPRLFDERVQHDGYENTYTLVLNGRKKILRPIKEIPPHLKHKGVTSIFLSPILIEVLPLLPFLWATFEVCWVLPPPFTWLEVLKFDVLKGLFVVLLEKVFPICELGRLETRNLRPSSILRASW